MAVEEWGRVPGWNAHLQKAGLGLANWGRYGHNNSSSCFPICKQVPIQQFLNEHHLDAFSGYSMILQRVVERTLAVALVCSLRRKKEERTK